jgi:hypothetical protein
MSKAIALSPTHSDGVALGDMDVPQLTSAFEMLHGIQGKYDKLSGICATMKGLVLAEVKHKIERGKFLPWVAKHYGKTRKSAAEDMRLAGAFCKSNPRVTFAALGRDMAATVKDLEQAQIDLKHPLVREIAGWVQERSRYQLLLAFPSDRGGDTTKSHKPKLKKSRDEIALEEAQITYLPLQKALMAVLQAKAKRRLLFLPLVAPQTEASLSALNDGLVALTTLVQAAMKQAGESR